MRQLYRPSLLITLVILTNHSAATAEGIPQFGVYRGCEPYNSVPHFGVDRGYGTYGSVSHGWLLRSVSRQAYEPVEFLSLQSGGILATGDRSRFHFNLTDVDDFVDGRNDRLNGYDAF